MRNCAETGTFYPCRAKCARFGKNRRRGKGSWQRLAALPPDVRKAYGFPRNLFLPPERGHPVRQRAQHASASPQSSKVKNRCSRFALRRTTCHPGGAAPPGTPGCPRSQAQPFRTSGGRAARRCQLSFATPSILPKSGGLGPVTDRMCRSRRGRNGLRKLLVCAAARQRCLVERRNMGKRRRQD